jgi:hypothetical protein
MTPSISKYKGLNFQVKLPSNIFLTNYPSTIQNIQVDFSDGLGYRVASYNQLLNVTYAQANIYIWKYKITLTNGQTLLSHSKIEIEDGINATQYYPNNQNITNNLSDYYKTTITATVPFGSGLFQYGSATVYIRFANGGNTITRPLIVAEGLDDGIILKPEQEAGSNNIEDFIDNIEFSQSILQLETNQYDIIYVDWNNGVDFIQKNAYVLEEVIKWVNANKVGNQQNVVLGQSMGGLVARYALRDIELNRNFIHDTRLYVSHDSPHLGANVPLSVQYSARHLRNQYINTPIPLLTGEVVLPIIFNFTDGIISLINNNTNWTVDGQPLQEVDYITPLTAFSLADAPAARQMQYNWINRSYQLKNFIHDAWQLELSNLGYPQGYTGQIIRNVAIANGSECGTTQPNNGNIMSYIKDAGRDTFLSNYIGILDAVYGAALTTNPLIVVTALFPGNSYWEIDFQSKYMTTLNENKNIYHGSIKYKKKVFWFIPVSITVTNKDVNQPTGILPYDIYGGGFQQTDVSNIPLAGSTLQSNAFGFIPTASALDVGRGTTTINDNDYRRFYIGALPPVSPKDTPFQNFVTHFDQFNPNNNNSSHISFNRRNGNWLRTELNTSIAIELTNCSNFCSNAQINGSDFLCTTGTYSVTNEATSANWSISEGNSLVTFSTNGNQITLNQTNQNQSGNVTLTVTYGNSRCGSSTVTKTIWVGKPKVNTPGILGGYNTVSTNSTSQLNVEWAEGNTHYYWSVTPYNTCSAGSGPTIQPTNQNSYDSPSRYVTINWGSCPDTYYVVCFAKNECGLTYIGSKWVTVYNPYGNDPNPCDNVGTLKLYPNPIKGSSII